MDIAQVAYAAGVIDDAPRMQTVALDMLSFVLSMAGLAAVLAFVAAAAMYMSSGGETKRSDAAKRMMTYSATGLLVVACVLVIVRQLTDMV